MKGFLVFKGCRGGKKMRMKQFFMDYINSLTISELESLHLDSGARFVIEGGKITEVEIEKAAPTI